MSQNLVIVPTYNEKENIESLIETIFALPQKFDVLIVDDGSPDGTGAIVKKLQLIYKDSLFLLERKGKLGLGTAYIAGFKFALEKPYEFIFEMDADFSHDPADLPRLLDVCKNGPFDLAVGSRYVEGGKVLHWDWYRLFLSRGASFYTRLVSGLILKDPTAGFVCYRRKILETINLDKISFVGYAFQIEMKFVADFLGFSITEVPITFKDRVEGESKMSMKIIKEAILGVLVLKYRSLKSPQFYSKKDAQKE